MARVSMLPRRSQEVPSALPMLSPAAHEPIPQSLIPGSPPNHLPPHATPPNHLPQQTMPGSPPNHLPPMMSPPLSEPATNSSVGGFSQYGSGPGSGHGMSQMPGSFSPESSAPEEKRGGLRKLIKRRPVGPA
jgi:hypothetical protein